MASNTLEKGYEVIRGMGGGGCIVRATLRHVLAREDVSTGSLQEADMFVPSRTAGAHVQSGLCDAISPSLKYCRLEAKACAVCTTHPILSVWHDSIVHL